MKKSWRYTLVGIFFCLLILGTLTLNSIYHIHQHSRLINYAGILRGATQRLVKNELNNVPSDEIIVQLDEIMDGLRGNNSKLDLPVLDDKNFCAKLTIQKKDWEKLKALIYTYRDNHQLHKQLADESEAYFKVSNDTVFAAEAYSEEHTTRLMIFIIIMTICTFVFWLFIYLSDIRKIGKLEISNKKLKDTVGRDQLTGAYNLERFTEIAEQYVRENKKVKYAFFYADFADFKYINDMFGYSYGDAILRKYTEYLQEDMREFEVFGRVNADNFVILRRYEKRSELIQRQEALDQKIYSFMKQSLNKQAIAIECGICCVEDVIGELTIEELLNRSNFARKIVKEGQTTEHYQFYNEGIRQHLYEEKAIEGNMEEAFKNHEFKVYYQPKVSTATGSIACSEALVRWEKADGTIIRPDIFIPVFEKNLTIPLLDRYIFEEVCKWLHSMMERGLPTLPVSINVSKLQFYHNDFVDTYIKIRDKYEIPDGLLEIEFTESIMYDAWDHLSEIVKKLRENGFLCTIDDFGKGYSSLSMINNLDIDVLKIDALFFQDFVEKKKDQTLVEGIIRLVKQFQITTVAEGIETKEQVELLKKMGCDLIQGYYYYRPLPQKTYEELLINHAQCS